MRKYLLIKIGYHTNMECFLQFLARTFHYDENCPPSVMSPFVMIHFESDLHTREVADKLDEIYPDTYMLFDVTEHGETFTLNMPQDMQRKLFNEVVTENSFASVEGLKERLVLAIDDQNFEQAARLRDQIANYKK